MAYPAFTARNLGITAAFSDPQPQLIRGDAFERTIRASYLGQRLKAHHFKCVGVGQKPPDDGGNAFEIVLSNCHRGSSLEPEPGSSPSGSDQLSELSAEAIQFGFGLCRPISVAAPALSGINMDAHFSQPALLHQPFEETGTPPKRFAVRHEHRHQTKGARVSDDLD